MNPPIKAACKIIPVIALVVCSFHSCNTGQPSKTQTGSSPAHIRSAYAIIDPTYNAEHLVPEPDVSPGAPWLYGPVELESWKHQQMQVSSKAVAHNGNYPGVYHVPFRQVSYRCRLSPEVELPDRVEIRSNAAIIVWLGEKEVFSGDLSERSHTVDLAAGINGSRVLLVKASAEAEPPALLIENGPFFTASGTWEWNDGITGWQAAAAFPQTQSGVLPHQMEMPEVILKPEKREGILYDFGRELIGYVTFHCDGSPSVIVGESVTEALDTIVSHHEQILTLTMTGQGEWTSKHPLAFRYLQILGKDPAEVRCRAQFWPTQYKGAFACSDSLLTRIWMAAAYTHRLNKYEFMLDGIKRDRLPWIDNMKISSAVEAYTFGDPEILKRAISVLGRESDKSSINNIIDYDALWVISQDAFQLNFDDPGFLRQEWPRIYAMIERIAATCDANGLRRWPQGSWTFIDWVSGWDKNMVEQVMRLLTGDSAEPVNSPSMICYEIQTLAETGKAAEALLKLKKIWGAMLDAGATTFWEGYDERETGDDIYRFYDRPG